MTFLRCCTLPHRVLSLYKVTSIFSSWPYPNPRDCFATFLSSFVKNLTVRLNCYNFFWFYLKRNFCLFYGQFLKILCQYPENFLAFFVIPVPHPEPSSAQSLPPHRSFRYYYVPPPVTPESALPPPHKSLPPPQRIKDTAAPDK